MGTQGTHVLRAAMVVAFFAVVLAAPAGAAPTSETMLRGFLRPTMPASPSDSDLFRGDSNPVSIVLVPGELPGEALAIVQVRPRHLERTFIILSEKHLSDVIIRRARVATLVYSVRHPEDQGFVEFALLPDGQLETRSASRGVEMGTHIPTAERTSGKNQLVIDLLGYAAAAAPSDYPGFGRVRVVEYIKKRG
jgi:hypothetical protein